MDNVLIRQLLSANVLDVMLRASKQGNTGTNHVQNPGPQLLPNWVEKCLNSP